MPSTAGRSGIGARLGLLLSALLGAAAAGAAEPADAKTVRMVKVFLRTPVEQVPPEAVEGFMALDPGALPKGLRLKTRARQLQLGEIRRLADGKKKGSWRTIVQNDCSWVEPLTPENLRMLRMAGFNELREDEKEFLEKKTDCREMDLMCEFSLKILEGAERGRLRRRYFLYWLDPLWAYVAEYNAGQTSNDTRFFGLGGSIRCAR